MATEDKDPEGAPPVNSLEIVSVSEEEVPVVDIAFSYFRFFLSKTKVEPGENKEENAEADESSKCHLFIPVKYLIMVLGVVLVIALAIAAGLIGNLWLFQNSGLSPVRAGKSTK